MRNGQRKLAAIVLFLTVTGCSSFSFLRGDPETAGTVNVAVTMVAPWDDYVAAMSTNFPLTAQEALSKVIPRTGVLEEKLIDVFGVTARVGLPQSSESLTRKTTTADEETTITEEKVEKREPGRVPDVGTAPGSDRAMKGLSGLTESDRRIAKDPILEYTAATALYQEVQLLNRYVIDAALRHNMTPYIVRLQIEAVPFKRKNGYDLYTKLGFFPKDTATKKTASAVVVPLLVTDNLEGMISSRSQDIIRQLSLALTLMKSGVGAVAGIDKIREDFQGELFSEMNSLFTVGRVTNNTIAARFGAVRVGKDTYATIPRTHNVTLVLMVPNDFQDQDRKNEVRVVARTTVRSAETGEKIGHQGRFDRQDMVAGHIREFVVDGDQFDPKKRCPDPEDDKEKEILCTQALLQLVWSNEFDRFHEYLVEKADWYKHIGRFERDLWMDIVDSLDASHYAGVRFQLPNPAEVKLPPDQSVFLADDGKAVTQGTLRGGMGLAAAPLGVILELKLGNGDVLPISGTVTPGSKGSNAILSFPSLAAWKIGGMVSEGTRLKGSAVRVYPEARGLRWNGSGATVNEYHYRNIHYQKPEAEKPAFSMRRSAEILKPDANNEGVVRIYVQFVKSNDRRIAESVEIAIDGGDLVEAHFSKEKETQSTRLTDELGKMTIIQDGTLQIKLRNIDKSKKVVLKGMARDAANKPVGADHPPLELEVKKD